MSFVGLDGCKHEISDFNNEWNKRAIELARQEYVRGVDRIVEMAFKRVDELEEINDIRFEDFYQSRIVGIVARNKIDYVVKRAEVALKKPLYYLNFRLAQSSIFD